MMILSAIVLGDDSSLGKRSYGPGNVGIHSSTHRALFPLILPHTVVAALGNLFWELEYSEIPAITPDLELAKLALVTSKDEEEDEHGPNDIATDSSASTDATLVDEPVPMGPAPAPLPPLPLSSPPTPSVMSPSPSVLGKRQRRARSTSTMDVDGSGDLDGESFVIVTKPKSPTATHEHRHTLSDVSEPKAEADGAEMAGKDHDVEMQDAAVDGKENKPPPLPPRRKQDVNSESVMMFGMHSAPDPYYLLTATPGKQHDVAECMDNCMFQIETALLRFDEMAGSDKSKVSVVKRSVCYRIGFPALW